MTDPASNTLWQVADDLERAPMPFRELPDRAREYIEAWVRTIDHGCGHPSPVHVSAMPSRSTVCPTCAIALGFESQTSGLCGRCRKHLGADGIVTVFAVSTRLIVFVSLCAACVGPTPDTQPAEEGNR